MSAPSLLYRSYLNDTRYNILVGEVCHIEADSVTGPRYNKTSRMTNAKVSPSGVMCQPHLSIIDNKSRLEEFTSRSEADERDHEVRSHNTVPTKICLSA